MVTGARMAIITARPNMVTDRTVGDGVSAQQILTTWFSPAYPVGAFSYSHGLEPAVERGVVTDVQSLHAWTEDLLRYGSGRTDAILLRHAYASDDPVDLSALAEALAPSQERHLETVAQGAACARTTSAAWDVSLAEGPYPVVVGQAAKKIGAPLDETVTLFLQAFAANIVSAGVRLVPLGQTDGQIITSRLLSLAAEISNATRDADIWDIGGCAIVADLSSMLHETQRTRLYRS